MTTRKGCELVAMTLAAVGATIHPAGTQAGDLIDLGVATAHAINYSGQVALDQGIYSGGTITALPTLSGGTNPASGLAINAGGQVAGSALGPAGGPLRPVAFINGTLLALVPDQFIGTNSSGIGEATGINDHNDVVGWIGFGGIDLNYSTFTYSNGTATFLPAFPCKSINNRCGLIHGPKAYGINAAGQVTGVVYYDIDLGTTDHCMGLIGDAYIYADGTWTDLGTGTGYAINGQGDVTGNLTPIVNNPSDCSFQKPNAFLYRKGVTTNLGTLSGGKNSSGYAINATGQIVGASDFAGGTANHAFFYNGVMTDLNAIVSPSDPLRPFVTLTDARGINDSRLIVANGVDSRTSLAHAYLLQGPWIDIAPGALTFGSAAVGGTSPQQTVTVTNSGAATLAISVSVSRNFFQTGNCGTSLAPSAQCTAMTTFTPEVAGALTGGLTISSGGVDYVVALSGTAPISASLTPSANTLNVGDSLTLTWSATAGSSCTGTSSVDSSFNNKTLQGSGSLALTQTTAGAVTYQMHCVAPGTQEVDASTAVTWNWPAVTVTLSGSPTTIEEGTSTTLSWSSTNATSCTATGGESGDNWAGTKATSGTQTVSEPFKLATSSTTLTFGILCTSSQSNLSAQASANVVVNDPPSSSGGGGALDLVSLVALLGIWKLRTADKSRLSRPR